MATRKTVYIPEEYDDVLPFFDKRGYSAKICSLIREAMKSESTETTQILSLLNEIKDLVSLQPQADKTANTVEKAPIKEIEVETTLESKVSKKDKKNLLSM